MDENLNEIGCAIANNIGRLAAAVTANAAPGPDAAGGNVSSLTEAVMGVTAGLCRIADAIELLAEAVREHRPQEVDQ